MNRQHRKIHRKDYQPRISWPCSDNTAKWVLLLECLAAPRWVSSRFLQAEAINFQDISSGKQLSTSRSSFKEQELLFFSKGHRSTWHQVTFKRELRRWQGIKVKRRRKESKRPILRYNKFYAPPVRSDNIGIYPMRKILSLMFS